MTANITRSSAFPTSDLARKCGQLLLVSALIVSVVVNPLLSAVLVLALGAVFFVHERAELAFWIVILLTPLETIGPITFEMTKIIKLGLTALVALVLYLDTLGGTKQQEGSDPYRWPFILVLISGIPASLLAKSPLISFAGLLTFFIFVFLYYAVRRHPALASQGPLMMKVVVAGAVVSAVLCLYQMTHGYSGIWGSTEQQSLESDQSYDTLWPLISRASAAFNGPNAAGAFLAIGSIAALMHVQLFRQFRWGYLLAFLICWAGVLSTFSRGALLGAIAGSIFALWALGWWTRTRAAVLACILAVGVGIVIMDRDVQSFFRLGADLASASPTRLDAWQAASVLIRRNPVFGIGFYEFHDLSQGIVGSSDTPVHPHNGFLKALVEEGPVGGIAYLSFVFAFLLNSKRSLRGITAFNDRWLLASIAGIGTSLFTQELFDAGFALGSSSLAILFSSLLALQTLRGPRPERQMSAAPCEGRILPGR